MSTRRRGMVVTRDGKGEPVPEYMLDQETITWPPGLPAVRPGQATPLISAENLYRRHEIVEGEAYLFLKHDFMPSDVPPGVIEELLSGGNEEPHS